MGTAVSQGIEFRRVFMSVRSAARFLSAAAQDGQVRDRFAGVNSPEEFLQVSQCMGYTFTTAELLRLVRVKSLKNETRRLTGVWKWLRGVNWR
jgi:Nif11 domain